MSTHTYLEVYLLNLTAAVTINVARYCYVCDNASDETCEDRYFGEHETDCEPVPPYDGGCSKFKTKTGIYGLEVYTGMHVSLSQEKCD